MLKGGSLHQCAASIEAELDGVEAINMVKDVRQNRVCLLRSMASFHGRITHATEENCGMNDIVSLHAGDNQEVEQITKDWSAC